MCPKGDHKIVKEQDLFQVDAFAANVFEGNPAAVVVTEHELQDSLMQAIANENNLAETAFVFGYGQSRLNIRWFTPTIEVDLCGHATLAAAHVLMTHYQLQEDLVFGSKSGDLRVSKRNDMLWLDFPIDTFHRCDQSEQENVKRIVGVNLQAVYRGRFDLMAVVQDQRSLEDFLPRLDEIKELPCRGLIVTAKGDELDFVSRFFAPQSGVPEDAVTGSAHTTLAPFWARELGKRKLVAKQLSARGGRICCEVHGDRVLIGGNAITYLHGKISV